HAVSRRHREGGQADDIAALGRAAAAGADAGDERRLDLRLGAGRDEPGHASAQAFPRGFDVRTLSNEAVVPPWPDLIRPPTSCQRAEKVVDGRGKPGHGVTTVPRSVYRGTQL